MAKNSLQKQKNEVLKVEILNLEAELEKYKGNLAGAEKEMGALEDNIRKLCETILAKDPEETKLGSNYSWRSVSTRDMISKAMTSYKKYNTQRTDLMKKTLDVAEERQEKIEGLEDQIQRLLIENENLRERLEGGGGHYEPPEATQESDAGQQPAEETPPQDNQEKAERQKPIPVRKDAHGMPVVTTEYLVDDDESTGIIKQAREMTDLEEQISPTPHSVPVFEPKQKIENKRKEKRESVEAHMVDLKQLEKKFTPEMWDIMEAIGGQGISLGQAIENFVFEKREKKVSPTKIRMGIQTMVRSDVISASPAKSPLSPSRTAYRLTQLGARMYSKKFHKEAVTSELERIIAEHDNVEHGYGILDVAEVLRASGRFKEVSIWNRHKGIKISDNSTYVPDIILTTEKGRDSYIEYERGTHTQEDFNRKCNKMCRVTRFVQFVVPNQTVMDEQIIPKLKKWMKSKGTQGLDQVVVRVSTARYLKDHEPGTQKCWQVLFKDGKPEPIYVDRLVNKQSADKK